VIAAQGVFVMLAVLPLAGPEPVGVTLAAAVPVVAYGESAVLRGAVVGVGGGQLVTIVGRLCGSAGRAKPVTTATTGAGGVFSATVEPLRNTAYTAQAGAVASPEAAVSVKPRLVLRKAAGGGYAITVRSSMSLAGRVVVLQRWDGALRRWLNRHAAVLAKGPAAAPPTVLSAAAFPAIAPLRSRVRASISRFQVGGCYELAVSNVVPA
jgi:hypothetical protein